METTRERKVIQALLDGHASQYIKSVRIIGDYRRVDRHVGQRRIGARIRYEVTLASSRAVAIEAITSVLRQLCLDWRVMGGELKTRIAFEEEVSV